MKKLLSLVALLASCILLSACSQQSNSQTSVSSATNSGPSQTFSSKILFINASQNKDGNTAQMGERLLDGLEYDQLNLVDYRINQLGQSFDGDQFQEVITAMSQADTIVIGTPVYWHTMSGSLKTLIDRFYDLQESNPLNGKKLYFFMQGSAPTEQAIESTEFIMTRVAAQTGMDLVGMADNDDEIAELHSQITQ